MKFAVLLLIAMILLQPISRGTAQGPSSMVLKGACTPDSHTVEGAADADLTKGHTQFLCDAAVVSIFHTQPAKVMIQFTMAGSRHGGPLGFAGVKTGQDIVALSHLYLSVGVATAVSDGQCKLFTKGGAIQGIACGAMAEADGRKTVAIVGFNAGH